MCMQFLKWAWLCARSESAYLSSSEVTKALAVVASSWARSSQQSGQVTNPCESMIFLTNLLIAEAARYSVPDLPTI